MRNERKRRAKIEKNRKKRKTRRKVQASAKSMEDAKKRQNTRKMKDHLRKKWSKDMAESHTRSVMKTIEDPKSGDIKSDLLYLPRDNTSRKNGGIIIPDGVGGITADEITEGNRIQTP